MAKSIDPKIPYREHNAVARQLPQGDLHTRNTICTKLQVGALQSLATATCSPLLDRQKYRCLNFLSRT